MDCFLWTGNNINIIYIQFIIRFCFLIYYSLAFYIAVIVQINPRTDCAQASEGTWSGERNFMVVWTNDSLIENNTITTQCVRC